jgi:hypothetical protein
MWLIRRILDIRHVFIGLAAAAAAVWIVQPYELRVPDYLPAPLDQYEPQLWNAEAKIRQNLGLSPRPVRPYTPQERVELGELLFARLFKARSEFNAIRDAGTEVVRKELYKGSEHLRKDRPPDLNLTDILRARLSPELWDAWRANLYFQALDGAYKEFTVLAKRTNRTREQEDQMWSLVESCGADLQIPYDETSKRFDLDAQLPKTAPEVRVQMIKEAYRILTGKSWESVSR